MIAAGEVVAIEGAEGMALPIDKVERLQVEQAGAHFARAPYLIATLGLVGSCVGLSWYVAATTMVGYGVFIGAFGVVGIVLGIVAAYENQRGSETDGGWS